MRYGTPSIASRIEALQAQGCDRLLVFPLYPQYSASTTAAVNDKAFDALKAMRYQSAVRTVPAYPADPVYIAALVHSIKSHLSALDWEPEAILASYHGLPKSYVEKGDPYLEQCALTTGRLAEALGALGAKLRCTFQSRFGRAEWLQPYTDKTVEALARGGMKRLAIVTFSDPRSRMTPNRSPARAIGWSPGAWPKSRAATPSTKMNSPIWTSAQMPRIRGRRTGSRSIDRA